MKIKGKLAVCEGVNTFFGMKNTYRYVRRGGWVGMVGMIRELFFTIRRFVLSTQGLEKITQGLEISSPGLEITSRRVVKTNPGLVRVGGRVADENYRCPIKVQGRQAFCPLGAQPDVLGGLTCCSFKGYWFS